MHGNAQRVLGGVVDLDVAFLGAGNVGRGGEDFFQKRFEFPGADEFGA